MEETAGAASGAAGPSARSRTGLTARPSTDPRARPRLLYVCTGNAARSVMATVITRHRSDLFDVAGAGTHVVEGCPMGMRTRLSLEALGLSDSTHRSTQLRFDNAEWADLIVTMEPGHVEYVRRVLPVHAHKTVTLRRLVKMLSEFEPATFDRATPAPPAPAPESSTSDPASARTAASAPAPAPTLRDWLTHHLPKLALAEITLEPWELVDDPGSGQLLDFEQTLEEVHRLVEQFLELMSILPSSPPQPLTA